MHQKTEISYLVSLLKVFDLDYVNMVDEFQISGLDVNNSDDVRTAVCRLMAPEFLTYPPEVKKRLLTSLQMVVGDERRLSELFDRISLAFKDALVDKQRFLMTIQDELRSIGF